MVIKITGHDADSLKAAAKKVLDYRDDVIDSNEAFLSVLCSYGIREARGHLSNVARDYDPPDFEAYEPQVQGGSNGKMSATLSLVGEDAAFVEFGAGIHYNGNPNSSSHPKGVELGFTIGSYGAHQGLHETWLYKEDGETKESQGTPTAAPLFHAKQSMEHGIPEVAIAAFRSK